MHSEWQSLLDIPVEELGRVGVLMGGKSAEREVSLNSGAAILAALCDIGVNAIGIDVGNTIPNELLDKQIDRAFIAMHGRGGEDGSIQAMLEWLSIPYTGTTVLGSALGMDKAKSKQLVAGAGISTPKSELLTLESQFDDVVEHVGLPFAVKPVAEGSSIGVTKVTQREQFAQALEIAFACGGDVIAERWVAGSEITVGVLAGHALPCVTMRPAGEFYDFDAKYEVDTTEYTCPSEISAELAQQLSSDSLLVFKLLSLTGWARVDYIVDAKGKPWFIEVNTVPGMTSHSLLPMAANAAGLGFAELCKVILAQTVRGK